MKRVLLLIAMTTLFIFGSVSALAKGPKAKGGSKGGGKGKQDVAKETVEKGNGKPAAAGKKGGQGKSKADNGKPAKRTRIITTRDPKTGKTSTREVEVSDKDIQEAKKRSRTTRTREPKPGEKTRTITTRDPKTGRTITKQVPVAKRGEAAEATQGKAKKEKGKAKVKDGDEDSPAAGKGKGKSAAKGKGKGQGKKNAALAKQFEHEAAKHETRKARLAEMLKVAEGKGDDKAVGRIQKLIDKEQGRYDKKHAKMSGRGEKEKSEKAADDTDDAVETEDGE